MTSTRRAALTPLLEKNVVKTIGLDVPVVFSMSRVIVLAFAVGMLRQLWRAGVAGWPEATLAIAIVLADLEANGDDSVLVQRLIGR